MIPEHSVPLTIAPARTPDGGRQPLAFVEVPAAATVPDDGDAPLAEPSTADATPGLGAAATPPRWSLWGDLEA